jgi:hypothetical protein
MPELVVLPPSADQPDPDTYDGELDEIPDLPELPMPIRINLAYEAYIKLRDANPDIKPNVRKIARSHGVVLSTLQGRIGRTVSKLEASQAMQRLSVSKEDALQD